MVRDVEPAPPPFGERGHRLHSARWEPAEPEREHHDQHQADPEERRRVGDQGQDRDQRVAPAVHAHRRQEAERDAGAHGDEEGDAHQEERRPEPSLDQVEHRHAVAEGDPEVQREDIRHVEDELGGQGAVEAEPRPELYHVLR